jgi:spermidine/putrescine transport system permease protein
MRELVRRYGVTLSGIIIALVGFWLLALVVFPNLSLLNVSFRPYLPVDQLGGPDDHYTLRNYITFVSGDPAYYLFGVIPISIHVNIFLLTILYSSVVTLVSLAISYPLAYYLAKVVKPSNAPTLFALLLIPLWVSEILRSFAWFIVLAYQGPLNAILGMFGIHAVRWISGFNGVIIGLVYTYILFMLFPIYNAITSLDSNQIEAARDLGASVVRTHRRVIMPHAKPGIASGCVMVFMLSAGSIIVPTVLASPGSRWFTQIIQQWFFEGQDWNTGSAYAFLLLVLCTVFVSVMMRVMNVRLVDIAK